MDYRNPDYSAIFEKRLSRLAKIRAKPEMVPALKVHYKANPVDFIRDWGVTSDPRNIERDLPAVIPLVPFARQEDWMHWLLARWRAGEGGLTEKSRDMGCSVCFMAMASTLALFHTGYVAGVGSRKEDLVDRVGDPKTLFYKARMFLQHVPREFRGGWDANNKLLSAHMKLEIPATGATITGEAGDNIGRGGRTSMYLCDEKAFARNQHAIDAALSQNTRCQIDLSSVNGPNHFAQKRHGGKVEVFTFHWREDPRKDDEWYAKEVARLDPLIVAQEIDLDYSASQDGVVIPSAWVQAAIDVCKFLGIEVPGGPRAALDVADEGRDKNAFAMRRSVRLRYLKSWSGKGSDIFATSTEAFHLCDTLGLRAFDYDADGLGAGVRGDARVLNERRAHIDKIEAVAWRGSGEVAEPDAFAIAPTSDGAGNGRTNRDFFANRKAQGWWHLRQRFQNTFRARNGKPYDPELLIDLSSELPELKTICSELSQPTYSINTNGKLLIDKQPDGMPSPNHADVVMMVYAPVIVENQAMGLFLPQRLQ